MIHSGQAPAWTPPAQALDELELLLSGAFGPVHSYMGRADYESVVTRRRLADGTPWPVPISLTVPTHEGVPVAVQVTLTDTEGVPLATLDVEDQWCDAAGVLRIGGRLSRIHSPESGVFRWLRRDAATSRAEFAGKAVIGVPMTQPLTQNFVATLRDLAMRNGARLLLMPLVPEDSDGRLVKATLSHIPALGTGTAVIPVPLRSFGDPAGDGLLQAHVAAAYGATAVVVELPLDRRAESPIEVISIPRTEDKARDLAATNRRGLTVFFTGLSGSGKSTIARAFRDVVLERTDRSVTLLDGDEVRRLLSAGLAFDRAGRELNVRRIGFVAAEVSRHGGIAICAPIAPYAATRKEVRQKVEAAGGHFMLVHVATPLVECERRDRKGLYAMARSGQLERFTGISDPFEDPQDADLSVDTTTVEPSYVVAQLLDLLATRGWLHVEGDATWTGG